MTDPVDIGPNTDLPIGGPGDQLFVGDSFDRIYQFIFPTDCIDGPVDFTGFTMTAPILDSTGSTIGSFAVTPSAGDTTGTVAIHLDTTDTTTALRDNAVAWQLRHAGGSIDRPLIHSSFKVT